MPINREATSAGLLMYRVHHGQIEVFLAHPGGPYFKFKDNNHWTIPKGEAAPGENLIDTAVREFQEETDIVPHGPYIPLESIRQRGGKTVHGWAFTGDYPNGHVHRCNFYKMEWPPGSGHWGSYPEVDRVGFFTLPQARRKMKDTQHPFLDRLVAALGTEPRDTTTERGQQLAATDITELRQSQRFERA